MDTQVKLPLDFKEFLRLLRIRKVEYLIVGGYAVSYHGHPRPTADLDIWISRGQENLANVITVLSEFGFGSEEVSVELFQDEKSLVTLGVEPFKIEIMTFVSGLEFSESFAHGLEGKLDGVEVQLISLADLRKNKLASGRLRDLADLEKLPEN